MTGRAGRRRLRLRRHAGGRRQPAPLPGPAARPGRLRLGARPGRPRPCCSGTAGRPGRHQSGPAAPGPGRSAPRRASAEAGEALRRQSGRPGPPGDGRPDGLARPAGPPPGPGLGLAGRLPGAVRPPDRLRRGHRHPPRDRPGRAPHRPHGRPQRPGPAEGRPLLRSVLGAGPVELWAYGDSAGDREMLAMADHPTRRRPRRRRCA